MASNRSKKAKANLQARQKAFDASGNRVEHGYKRPGSHSGRK